MENAYLELFEKKKIVLIMSLPVNNPALARAAFEEGADAVKVHINVAHRASGTHFGRLSEEGDALQEMLAHRTGPMGLVPGGSLEDAELDLKEVQQLPFDFLSIYAHHLPAYAAEKGRQAWMMACDSTYSLEEIAELPTAGTDVLEASIIPGAEYGQRLSVRDLLKYRAITSRVNVPVIVPTQRAVRPEEVKELVSAGVRGIMIGAIVTGREEKSIREAVRAFRREIDRL